MYIIKLISWLIFIFLNSSCLLNKQSGDSTASTGEVMINSCTYQERDMVSVGNNPTADFYQINAGTDQFVLSSTCAGLPAGYSAFGVYSSVQRYGNYIYFKQGTNESILTVSGSNTLTRNEDVSACIDGVQIDGVLTSAQYNTTSQKIILDFVWTLTKNQCVPTQVASIDPFIQNSTANYLWYFDSMYGDYIGQGRVSSANASSATLTASRNIKNGVTLNWNGGGASWFTFNFSAANGATLVPGVYTGATRMSFSAVNENGMDISGSGRGCNTVSGSFEVLNATYDGSGNVLSFAANFIQHCDGGTSFLKGTVRYNWSPPLL